MSLLLAWLCASGAMLDLAQVVAWGHMFAGYSSRESVLCAARDTFDPAKPCALCRAVSQARDAASQHAPLTKDGAPERLVMFLPSGDTPVFTPLTASWSPVSAAPLSGLDRDVPVPPPRRLAA